MKVKNKYKERSAGGVVFRKKGRRVWWLVVKVLGKDKYRKKLDERPRRRMLYKLPKGHVETDESVRKAAKREVEEEGRVRARIVDKLADRNYVYKDRESKVRIVKRVTFFLMEYQSPSLLRHKDDELVVDRLWLPWWLAKRRLSYKSERQLLEKAKKKIER